MKSYSSEEQTLSLTIKGRVFLFKPLGDNSEKEGKLFAKKLGYIGSASFIREMVKVFKELGI